MTILTEIDRRFMRAQSAIVNTMNPTPQQWAEYDAARDAWNTDQTAQTALADSDTTVTALPSIETGATGEPKL